MTRSCAFCGKGDLESCGPFLGPFKIARESVYIHGYCAYFSWNVWMNISEKKDIMEKFFVCPDFSSSGQDDLHIVTNELKNIRHTMNCTSRNKCHVCWKGRATTGCAIASCPNEFHFPCTEGRARLFYCSLAYVGATPKEGKYGFVRPHRFAICSSHEEWEKDEYKQLTQFLDIEYKKRIVNVDELPLYYRQLVSTLSNIEIYQPNLIEVTTVQGGSRMEERYTLKAVNGDQDTLPSHMDASGGAYGDRLLITRRDNYPYVPTVCSFGDVQSASLPMWCGCCGGTIAAVELSSESSHLTCSKCAVSVHKECLIEGGAYERSGEAESKAGNVGASSSSTTSHEWTCAKCHGTTESSVVPWYKQNTTRPCLFCRRKHPHIFSYVMPSGFWSHVCCGCTRNVELGSAECSLCNENTGSVMRCSERGCRVKFHMSCAWLHGYAMTYDREGSNISIIASCGLHGARVSPRCARVVNPRPRDCELVVTLDGLSGRRFITTAKLEPVGSSELHRQFLGMMPTIQCTKFLSQKTIDKRGLDFKGCLANDSICCVFVLNVPLSKVPELSAIVDTRAIAFRNDFWESIVVFHRTQRYLYDLVTAEFKIYMKEIHSTRCGEFFLIACKSGLLSAPKNGATAIGVVPPTQLKVPLAHCSVSPSTDTRDQSSSSVSIRMDNGEDDNPTHRNLPKKDMLAVGEACGSSDEVVVTKRKRRRQKVTPHPVGGDGNGYETDFSDESDSPSKAGVNSSSRGRIVNKKTAISKAIESSLKNDKHSGSVDSRPTPTISKRVSTSQSAGLIRKTTADAKSASNNTSMFGDGNRSLQPHLHAPVPISIRPVTSHRSIVSVPSTAAPQKKTYKASTTTHRFRDGDVGPEVLKANRFKMAPTNKVSPVSAAPSALSTPGQSSLQTTAVVHSTGASPSPKRFDNGVNLVKASAALCSAPSSHINTTSQSLQAATSYHVPATTLERNHLSNSPRGDTTGMSAYDTLALSARNSLPMSSSLSSGYSNFMTANTDVEVLKSSSRSDLPTTGRLLSVWPDSPKQTFVRPSFTDDSASVPIMASSSRTDAQSPLVYPRVGGGSSAGAGASYENVKHEDADSNLSAEERESPVPPRNQPAMKSSFSQLKHFLSQLDSSDMTSRFPCAVKKTAPSALGSSSVVAAAVAASLASEERSTRGGDDNGGDKTTHAQLLPSREEQYPEPSFSEGDNDTDDIDEFITSVVDEVELDENCWRDVGEVGPVTHKRPREEDKRPVIILPPDADTDMLSASSDDNKVKVKKEKNRGDRRKLMRKNGFVFRKAPKSEKRFAQMLAVQKQAAAESKMQEETHEGYSAA